MKCVKKIINQLIGRVVILLFLQNICICLAGFLCDKKNTNWSLTFQLFQFFSIELHLLTLHTVLVYKEECAWSMWSGWQVTIKGKMPSQELAWCASAANGHSAHSSELCSVWYPNKHTASLSSLFQHSITLNHPHSIVLSHVCVQLLVF